MRGNDALPRDGPVPPEAEEVLEFVAELVRRIRERKRWEREQRIGSEEADGTTGTPCSPTTITSDGVRA